MSVSVPLFVTFISYVCLSVREHISGTAFRSLPHFYACYACMAVARGLPLALRNVTYTSGFVDDVSE